jgi:hypothetical protein
MGIGVSLDLALGVGALFAVPYHRPNAVVPSRGAGLYLAHAVLGLVLAAVGVAVVPGSRRLGRLVRIGATSGVVGLAIAGVGGLIAALQVTRLPGMALMLAGATVSVAGYLMPLIDSVPTAPGSPAMPGSPETPG